MNKHYYHTYGLTVSSEISFFEMEELPEQARVDADIVVGMPPEWVINEYKEGSFSSIRETVMWFRLYDELLIYVENGNHAIVWPINPKISESQLHTFTLSGVFTFLLFQRGYLCVHGSALAYKNRAFIVSGPSGSGKSTTALELLKLNDILFLSDDICPLKKVGSQHLLFPGPPWQKVCNDVMEREPGFDYSYLEESGGKYGRHLFEKYVTTPLPICAMFIITKADCPNVRIEELNGQQKLKAFTQNLFRGELLNILGVTPQRMIQMLEIINGFSIYRIYRPLQGDTLKNVTDIIKEHLAKKLQLC